MECHQQDVRPNWEPYSHWPGFYGSDDDNVNARFAQPSGEDRLTTGPENEWYAKYLDKKHAQVEAKQGRYRFLPKHPAERPNLDFNDRVICLNMKRMLRSFSQLEASGDLLPFIRTGRLHVKGLPPAYQRKMRKAFDEVERDVSEVMDTAVRKRIERHVEVTGAPPMGRAKHLYDGDYSHPSYDKDIVASWKIIFEDFGGKAFRPFSTSRHTDYHLNLGSAVDLGVLLTGATIDPNTHRAVLSTAPQVRAKDPLYGFVCPKSASYYDLPIQSEKDRRREEMEYWQKDEFTEEGWEQFGIPLPNGIRP